MSSFATADRSVMGFLRLSRHHELKHERSRIGCMYAIEGCKYKVFRETYSTVAHGENVILVIGFRLKIVRSSRIMHWLFQRVCVITTPFWSGLNGFKTKLWMHDPATKNYLGIYDWRGKAEAQKYLDFLMPILKFFSVRGTVWSKQIYDQDLKKYLASHQSNWA